jgi:hypothetical protein
VLSPGAAPVDAAPVIEADPPIVETKNGIWRTVAGLVGEETPDPGVTP